MSDDNVFRAEPSYVMPWDDEQSSWFDELGADELPMLGRSILSTPPGMRPLCIRDHRRYQVAVPRLPETTLDADQVRATLWPNVVPSRAPSVPVARRSRPMPYRDPFSAVPLLRTGVPGIWAHADDLDDGGQRDKYRGPAGRRLHREHYPSAYYRLDEPCEPSPSAGRHLLRLPKERPWTLDNMGRCMVADRSRQARELWALERAADRILRDAGEHLWHLDVIDRKDRLPVVAPDPAAYRGPVRVTIPRRVRYEHRAEVIRVGGNVSFASSPDPTPDECHDAWADAMLGRGVTITLHATLLPDRGVRYYGGSGPVGWYGRKTRTGNRAETVERIIARESRPADVVGKRGIAATFVSAARASLYRYLSRAEGDVKLAAARIAKVIEQADHGARIPLTAGASIIVVNRREAVLTLPADLHEQVIRDTAIGVAQRAALLGLDL